jgi:hypothetical protein
MLQAASVRAMSACFVVRHRRIPAPVSRKNTEIRDSPPARFSDE